MTISAMLIMVVSGLPVWSGVFSFGQPSATLWKDQLFVAITAHTVHGVLYRGSFAPEVRRVRSPLEHYNPQDNGHTSTQAKIEIRDDRLLLCPVSDDYYIFPMSDVPFLERGAFGATLRVHRAGTLPREDYLKLQNDPQRAKFYEMACFSSIIDPCYAARLHLLLPAHRKPDVPVSNTILDDGDTPSVRNYMINVRHDILIVGPKSVRLFHAFRDSLFVSIEPDYLNSWYMDGNGNVAKNLPKPPERQLRTGKLPADFIENFAAYHAGVRDYLVTPSGKVYIVVPKGTTEVDVSAVWNNPKQKIVGVVQDPTNDAVYGWGYVNDSSEPERFYLKFEPKPVAVAYKLTVPLWNERSDAYLESYECARAFRKAREKK